MDEIINKVSQSKLQVFDLEDFYPKGFRIQLDISQWLEDGYVLMEKKFRQHLQEHNFSNYADAHVNVYCSTDAIVPAWASILVALHLAPYAATVVAGSSEDLETYLYSQILAGIDYTTYKDVPVIIKGCSRKPVPMSAYIMAAKFLQPFAKSIMYGEACSAVPLYKNKSQTLN